MATFQLPAQNSYTPKPRAEVLAKRAAAKEAKKARQAAALAELRCDCGKQFQSKDALKKHRKDAVMHKEARTRPVTTCPKFRVIVAGHSRARMLCGGTGRQCIRCRNLLRISLRWC